MNLDNPNTSKVALTDIQLYSRIPTFDSLIKKMDKPNKYSYELNNISVLYGKSGTCKTALASGYAYSKTKNNRNMIVKWLDGSNQIKFMCDLKLAEKDLNTIASDYYEENIDDVYVSIKNAISKLRKKFVDFEVLLIIKNPYANLIIYDLIKMYDSDYSLKDSIKILILTDNERTYKHLDLKHKTETEYFPSDSCVDFIFYGFFRFSNDDIRTLFPLTETLPLKCFQIFSLMKYNPCYSLNDIIQFNNNKIDFIKARNPKSFEIMIYLAMLNTSQYISLKLLKEIFVLEPQEEIGSALDFLIHHSLLVKSHSNQSYTAYYVHDLTIEELLRNLSWNNFNRSYIINRIVIALDKLLNDNDDIYDSHNVLIFKHAYDILVFPRQILSKSYASLFLKVENIKKRLFKYENDSNEAFVNMMIMNSNLLADFRQIDLDENKFNLIKQRLIQNSHIFEVKWNLDSEWLKQNREKINEVNLLLENNFSNYERYPSDFVHGVLAYFATDLKLANKRSPTLKDLNLSIIFKTFSKNYINKAYLKWKIDTLESEWKVNSFYINACFKCFAFCNDKRKQLVIAFSGMKFEVRDLFDGEEADTNSFETFIKSMVTNHNIPFQTSATYDFTKVAVAFCASKDYTLSFTGFSFGAWLAEQAVFFCHNDFNKFNVKSVTFDSPGSFEFLEKLNQKNIKQYTKYDLEYSDLDMRTFLSAPNIINSLHYHIGKVFYVKTPNKKELTKAELDKKINEKGLANVVLDKIKKYGTSIKKFLIDRLFRALKISKLRLMLRQFDLLTEKPYKNSVLEIGNWPKVEINIEAGFEKNFSKLISSSFLYRLSGTFNMLPFGTKQTIIRVTDLVLQPLAKELFDVTLKGISLLVSTLIEILNSKAKFDQLNKTYEFGFRKLTNDNENISDSDRFHLKYEAKFQIAKTDLFSGRLEPSNGNVDWYLKALKKIDVNDIDKFIKNRLVNKELKRIISLIRFSVNDQSVKIISSKDKNINLETIKNRFEQLLIYNKDLKYFLANYSESYQIKSDELNFDFKNLIPRESYLDKMDLALTNSQYFVLKGESGVGKSVLAAQFIQHRLSYESDTIFKWINCSLLQLIKNDLMSFIKDFDESINLDGVLDISKLVDILREKINYNYYKYTFLIILDNVTELEYISDFTHGFCTNIQFIITTKIQKIDIDKIEKLKNSKNMNILLDLINNSDLVLPLEADIKEETNVKSEFDRDSLAKEILDKFTILNCDFISFKLIELLFPNKNNLKKEFEYLVENGYFKQNVIQNKKNYENDIYYMHQSLKDLNKDKISINIDNLIEQVKNKSEKNPSYKMVLLNQLDHLTHNHFDLIKRNKKISDILEILIEFNGKEKNYLKLKSNIDRLKEIKTKLTDLELFNKYGLIEYQFKLAKERFDKKDNKLALNYFENLINHLKKEKDNKNVLLDSCKYKINCLYNLGWNFENLKDLFQNMTCAEYGLLYLHLATNFEMEKNNDLAIKYYIAAIRNILQDENPNNKTYLAEVYFDLALVCQKENQDDLARLSYKNFIKTIKFSRFNLNLLSKLKENIDCINQIDKDDLATDYYKELINVSLDKKLDLVCNSKLLEIYLERHKKIINSMNAKDKSEQSKIDENNKDINNNEGVTTKNDKATSEQSKIDENNKDIKNSKSITTQNNNAKSEQSKIDENKAEACKLEMNIYDCYEYILRKPFELLNSVYTEYDDYLAIAHHYINFLKFTNSIVGRKRHKEVLDFDYFIIDLVKNLTLNKYDENKLKVANEDIHSYSGLH